MDQIQVHFHVFFFVPRGALQEQIPSARFYPVFIFGSGVPSLAIIVVQCTSQLLSTRDYTEHGQIVVIRITVCETSVIARSAAQQQMGGRSALTSCPTSRRRMTHWLQIQW